ncbi:DUF4129 domain-containing protein [Roseimaritima sediminicola]|uniref:DUF4129 domain-containing protein n=1 Tax=Roseimaritima sediminicola TaxID=2662066 RepID=UPI0012985829|nr:DUF4129 domain-containing protein [Roseimaritima sediminicola]
MTTYERLTSPSLWSRTESWHRVRPIVMFGLAVLVLPAVLLPSAAAAADPVEQELVETIAGTPWYDSDGQQLRPVTVRERLDDASNRDSRWLPKPKRVRQSNQGLFSRLRNLFASMQFGNLFGWTMMIILAVALIAMLIYFFSKSELEVDLTSQHKGSRTRQREQEELTERMEQLPVEVRQGATDMRGEAQRLMSAGDYDRAIIFLFGHQLLQLDRCQMLRLARGKTNRQYVREVRSHGEAGRMLQQTVDSFEASYFGRHGVTVERFKYLWQENEKLEKLLRQQHEVAA